MFAWAFRFVSRLYTATKCDTRYRNNRGHHFSFCFGPQNNWLTPIKYLSNFCKEKKNLTFFFLYPLTYSVYFFHIIQILIHNWTTTETGSIYQYLVQMTYKTSTLIQCLKQYYQYHLADNIKTFLCYEEKRALRWRKCILPRLKKLFKKKSFSIICIFYLVAKLNNSCTAITSLSFFLN